MADTHNALAGPSTPRCKTPTRKRRIRASITNEFSVKRQRISIGPIDIATEPIPKNEYADVNTEPRSDRFISTRPDILFPINTTPRTNRVAQMLGLADDRFLNFTDSTSAPPDKMMLSLRRSASQLFHTPATLSPTSSLSHLAKRRQFILALDGPGIPQDPWAYPLSWSKKNVIAVACGHDIYYQNLDTREIAHLCNLPRSTMGRIRALEFAEDVASCNLVALGTTTGSVQVWDTGEEKKRIRLWSDANWAGATVVSWKGAKSQEFVVGRHDGKMSLYDVRVEKELSGWKGHKGDVFGAKWSEDQRFLASVDNRGTVLVWDSRNMSTKLAKMRHIGPAKALAWCPWKPDLLATAGTYPDGTIKIWSASNFNSPSLSASSFASASSSNLASTSTHHTGSICPTPLSTITVNSSIYSLHWSPHCKELLSVHGLSWLASPFSSSPSNDLNNTHIASASLANTPIQPAPSALTNSITVHSWPNCKRLVSVTAHSGTVGQSCLSPDGTMVFTLCYREEAMKMWKVWGERGKGGPGEEGTRRAFEKFSIR
ncbi:WD40 repeat-like protein [Stereum hirsutum FP-91666 SS1]|uniref:WD40 repeat-like protein n=1 Tax=Stereum hirsutum (strain FP-91666) TaxID=721885 RepID=R7S0W2_STEHR|nr:WD40 repeat-like protein [Stereum hirsutum FP-91666 SS1]EIM80192.1 WD40 repeat-like protein [Stereum hirsutum FP-91666 SS1]